MSSIAEDWIKADVFKIDRLLKREGLDTQPLPELVATDPSTLIRMAKALAVEAVMEDAPEGVVEQLMESIRRMTAGHKNVGQYAYAGAMLPKLIELETPEQVAAALRDAAEKAPDTANREKLMSMAVAANLKTAGPSDPSCIPCCLIGCTVCTEACVICCVAGCYIC